MTLPARRRSWALLTKKWPIRTMKVGSVGGVFAMAMIWPVLGTPLLAGASMALVWLALKGK